MLLLLLFLMVFTSENFGSSPPYATIAVSALGASILILKTWRGKEYPQ